MSLRQPSLQRDLSLGRHLERLLIAAVVTILVTRAYLTITGFPQVGGGGLHIAHMLWGGLLMLVANVLMLSFLGRAIRNIASVVGGIGLGLFIDELGKFITSDNDYFFQPTIAIIYVVFVILFLVFRALERKRQFTDIELLSNTLITTRDVLAGHLSAADIRRDLAVLTRLDEPRALVSALRSTLSEAERRVVDAPGLIGRTWGAVTAVLEHALHWRWLHRAVIGMFVVEAVFTLLVAGLLLYAVESGMAIGAGEDSMAITGHTVSSVISAGLVLVGVVLLPRWRHRGYRVLRASVLISIFLVQVFLFAEHQFGALTGLVVDLVLLGALDAMMFAAQPAARSGSSSAVRANASIPTA